MPEPVVHYEERGSVAIVTLNRPDKLNTLTEEMVQGVADAIDRAAASRAVPCARSSSAAPAGHWPAVMISTRTAALA